MRLTANAATTPYRFTRSYDKPTRILIQVKHATAKIFFGTDQGEVANGGSGPGTDAICLMAANTNPAVTPQATPFGFTVMGELWYSSDTAGADFVFWDVLSVTDGG